MSKVGDYIYNLGKIQEVYGNQYKINNQWYHDRIIKEQLLLEKIYNIKPQKVRNILSKVNKKEEEILILKKIYELDCQCKIAEMAPELHKLLYEYGHIMNNIRNVLKVA